MSYRFGKYQVFHLAKSYALAQTPLKSAKFYDEKKLSYIPSKMFIIQENCIALENRAFREHVGRYLCTVFEKFLAQAHPFEGPGFL